MVVDSNLGEKENPSKKGSDEEENITHWVEPD